MPGLPPQDPPGRRGPAVGGRLPSRAFPLLQRPCDPSGSRSTSTPAVAIGIVRVEEVVLKRECDRPSTPVRAHEPTLLVDKRWTTPRISGTAVSPLRHVD